MRKASERVQWRIEFGVRYRLLTEGSGEWIADNHRLPAQRGHCQIEALDKVEAREICGEENLRSDGGLEVPFGNLSCDASDSLADQVTGE